MKGKKTMLATNHDAPAWSRVGRALRQPEPKTDLQVDTERLVWDQEYRDEVRSYLKAGKGKT